MGVKGNQTKQVLKQGRYRIIWPLGRGCRDAKDDDDNNDADDGNNNKEPKTSNSTEASMRRDASDNDNT